MVIERFKNGEIGPVGERFRVSGRMMPEGLTYQASWIDPAGTVCYQLMEAANEQLLEIWMSHWRDLVDFEVVPVLTSADFWAGRQQDK